MTAILTTSVMALSAITPAALFSFLGIEKYGSKHKFAWNIKPSGFSIDLYRADFERYVQKHFQSQLEKQVSFMIGEKQRYGYIRQVDHNKFTFFINYNSPIISIQRTSDGWIECEEDIKYPKELFTQFIMILENRLFN